MRQPLDSLTDRDSRQVAQIVADLLARRTAFVPEWQPETGTVGSALVEIVARDIQTVIQRLNQAPHKHRLAFLDMLGVRLIPAQAARTPIVFTLVDNAAEARLPAGTRIAAPPGPGQTDQIIFETEQATGVAVARIEQVVSIWPGRDQYIDHSKAASDRTPFRPFNRRDLEDAPHTLYLAHDTLLSLAGRSRVDVGFELTTPGNRSLPTIWEYWDGKVWRQFSDMQSECGDDAVRLDGTAGFTRSGSIQLETACATTELTTVNGNSSFWVRGRLDVTLPPDPARILPEVDAITLTTQVAQPLVLDWTAKIATAAAGTTGALVRVQDATGVPLRGVVVTDVSRESVGTQTDANGEHRIDTAQNGDVFTAAIGEFRGDVSRSASTYGPQDVTFTLKARGLKLDKAIAEGAVVDVSTPFFPFGQQPQPGAAFYFTNEEAFSKPGATVRIYIQTAQSPQDEVAVSGSTATQPTPALPHTVSWEYWNGSDWQSLLSHTNKIGTTASISPDDFTATGLLSVDLVVPKDLEETTVNNQPGRWMRVRLASGTYAIRQTIPLVNHQTFTFNVPKPPILSAFLLGYSWRQGPFPPQFAVTYNDFEYGDRTELARWPGDPFQPFVPLSGNPALYIGLSRSLPVDRIGMLFDIEEVPEDQQGPALRWSYWGGINWRPLIVDDETGALRRPGIVSLIGPNDSQSRSWRDTNLYWLRAELRDDGEPGAPLIRAIDLNAVWAAQHLTVLNEAMGASTGDANQVFGFRQLPVLAGEQVEIREVAGRRANVEWRLIARDLFPENPTAITMLDAMLTREGTGSAIEFESLRLERDRTKRVTEVWVRWQGQLNFYGSGPQDRHYVVDRARGRLLFGDGLQGRIPPVSAAIQARMYRTGGGAAGNLPSGSITQLLAPIGGIGVIANPLPAQGGADGETPEMLSRRGPWTIRRRGRALSASDYETAAREATPGVARAWVVPAMNEDGAWAPGWVRLVILPNTTDRHPWPSFGLRQAVLTYVGSRAPAGVAGGRIVVTGPTYRPVDVQARLVPLDPSAAGQVEQRARQAIEDFLHPIRGGRGGQGWQPGQGLFVADIAAVLEGVDGIDFTSELAVSLDGALFLDRVPIDAGRVVAAGTIQLAIVEE